MILFLRTINVLRLNTHDILMKNILTKDNYLNFRINILSANEIENNYFKVFRIFFVNRILNNIYIP